MDEIERKWLVKSLPDLSDITPLDYERYYLFRGNGIELRAQRINEKYELERKVKSSSLSRTIEKIEISKEEFKQLKKLGSKVVIRKAYNILNLPNTSIKIYEGEHKGLIRVEVEFENEEDAETFQPPDWFGKEITNTALGKDSALINLDHDQVTKLIMDLQ